MKVIKKYKRVVVRQNQRTLLPNRQNRDCSKYVFRYCLNKVVSLAPTSGLAPRRPPIPSQAETPWGTLLHGAELADDVTQLYPDHVDVDYYVILAYTRDGMKEDVTRIEPLHGTCSHSPNSF